MKRNRGHERDVTQLASNGSIPTRVAPKLHVTARVSEVRHKGVEPIFSATPPVETLRVLLCVASHEDVFRVEDPFLIFTADVSRAHFNADAVREVYVRLPDEDPKAKEPGVCGKLCKTTYGSLDASQRWTEPYAQVLVVGGFSLGVASPCHLFHKELQTYILVHGDDFSQWADVRGESMH